MFIILICEPATGKGAENNSNPLSGPQLPPEQRLRFVRGMCRGSA